MKKEAKKSKNKINFRNQERKNLLLSKASYLFWKKGYQGTSMRDLAKAFNCKPANIYNYFPNKEYILYEILLDQMQKIVFPIRRLEDDDEANPIDQLKFLITTHLAATLEYEKSYKLLYDVGIDNLSPSRRKKIVALRDEYERILQKIIRRGIESGHFKEIDEKMAVYCIASMIARTMLWYSPKGRLTKDQIIDFIFNFSLKALKGNTFINKNESIISTGKY